MVDFFHQYSKYDFSSSMENIQQMQRKSFRIRIFAIYCNNSCEKEDAIIYYNQQGPCKYVNVDVIFDNTNHCIEGGNKQP